MDALLSGDNLNGRSSIPKLPLSLTSADTAIYLP